MKPRLPRGIRRPGSIRTRLTLWNVLGLTVALIAVALQIRYSVRANIMASIDQELASMSRYAARQTQRRPRVRIGAGPLNRGGFDQSSFSSTIRQLDAQIGLPTPPGTEPALDAASAASPGISVLSEPPNNTPANSPISQPTPSINPAPTGRRRQENLANSPATRVLFNGRTFMFEPPWDSASYSRAITENIDVFTTVNRQSRRARILTHPMKLGVGGIWAIQTTFPLNEMDPAVHSLDVTLLTTIPLVLIIAGFGGAFLTDRAMRPIRLFTRTAEQIGAEDLSRRLPVGSGDEFSHLAGTFNAMLTRLEASFTQQRRFTSDASHELKSPLTVIKANTSLALRSPRTNEEYIRRLEAIDKAANNMRALVDDLLLLARADEGHLAQDLELLDLTEILKEAVEFTHRPDAAQVTFTQPHQPMHINGDRREIARVFRNLIDNAVRYTPQSGTVTISVQDEGVACCVSVSDTGPGISPEHLEHIGERFYRLDESRARIHGGTGLGLAISRGIVEAHHGVIKFNSGLNVGTTVLVTLPFAES